MNYKGHVSLCPNALSYLAKASVNVSAPEIFAKFSDKLVLFTLAKYYAHKNLELIVETFSRCRDRLSDVICIITIDKSQHPNADSLLEELLMGKILMDSSRRKKFQLNRQLNAIP